LSFSSRRVNRHTIALCAVIVASAGAAAPPPGLDLATELQLLRLEPSSYGKHNKNGFHGYRVIAGPVQTNAQTREALARTLMTAYSVAWPPMYCAFMPVYAASFTVGTRHIDVLMCPGCDEMRYFDGSRLIQTADFRAARRKIVSIYNSSLPETR
jgi:hypothetical protein